MDMALIIHAERHGKFVSNQMMRPFGDSSLMAMALQKLAHVDVPCRKLVATADPEIRMMAQAYPELKVVRMADDSVPESSLSDAYQHLSRLPEEWFLDINPAYPLVDAEFWWEAVEQFLSTPVSGLVSAHRIDGGFFDEDGLPVQNDSASQVLNGAFRLISKTSLLNEGSYWNPSDEAPHAFHLPRAVAWGVREAEDLSAVEAIWSLSRMGVLAG